MLTHYMLRERDSEGEDNTQKFIGMERETETRKEHESMQKQREQQQDATTEMIDNEKSVYMETNKLTMGTHTCSK